MGKTMFQGLKERSVLMAILLAVAGFLTYYSRAVLDWGTALTHFFYIPIILASLWWRRKGLLVAIFLVAVLLTSHVFLKVDTEPLTYDLFEAAMFIIVALVVAMLSERMEKRTKETGKERRFSQNIIATVPDSLVVLDKDLKIKSANRAFYETFQIDEKVICGSNIAEVLHDGDGKLYSQLKKLAQTEDILQNFEMAYKSEKLGERVLSITARGMIVAEEEEEEEEELMVIQDITEQKRAEEALKESEERYRTLVSNISLGIFRSTPGPRGRFLEVNPAMERITGYSREELLRMDVCDLYQYPEERERVLEEIASATGMTTRELRFRKKDGMEITVSDTKVVVRDDAGQIMYFDGIMEDITERKKMENEIKRVAIEWQATFDSITDLVSIVDRDFRLVRVNRAFADAFGKRPKELLGKPCYEVAHKTNGPIANCPRQETLQTKKPASAEFFEPTLGIYLEETTSPILNEKGELIGSVGVARDITERKRAQEQLMLTDRLASIGELASGIAHELNNPLTSVIGFSQLLMERDIADDMKEDLSLINSEAQRTAGIVKNLLTFARKHAPVKQLSQINNVIEDVLRLRAYEQKVNNIEVKRQLAANLPEIMVDYFQMQQVFLNIIINAEYFMIQAHNRGTLTITTQRLDNTVRVSVADDGPGIPKENLSRIFTPFFTTKEVGKGTGLGLSICHGIVAEHEGRIYARSRLGKGATFVVELPIDGH